MKNLCDGIKTMKNNNAAGLDDILCEQINHLGPVALQWLLDMLNCMSTNTFPKLWRKSRGVLLNPGKGPAIPKSYAHLSTMSYMYMQLFERLILAIIVLSPLMMTSSFLNTKRQVSGQENPVLANS